ncbi:MAG: polyphosphate polymerase domain-containing protein [Fastidiosipilaceae bacterium]
MIYRNEQKYIVDELTLQLMTAKLDAVMDVDRHQVNDSYRVRSMYFDTYERKSYRENDAGVEERQKFRIRVYDDPRSTIKLEIKHKLKNKNYKESCAISEEQLNAILSNSLMYDPNHPKPLRVFYLQMRLNLLRPSIIVEYQRRAYVYGIGNVRVTFDRNIAYSYAFDRFLDQKIPLTPLLEMNQHVLEVKYDKLLPEIIAQVIETGELYRRTFSKFYNSHQSSEGEGFQW